MTILPNLSSSGFTSGDTVVSSLCELRKRPLSSIPAFSALQDRIQNVLTLFLPKTLNGIMEFEEKVKVGSFSSVNKSILIQSFIGFISPLMILWFIDFISFMIFNNNNRLLSMEPLRLADSRFGNTDVKTMKGIMNSITNEILLPSTSKSKSMANMGNNADNNIGSDNNKKIIEFTLMGHSLGAFAAMKLFRELVVDNNADITGTKKRNDEDKAKHNQQQPLQQQHKESSMTVIATKKSFSIPEIEIGISNKLIMWGVAAFIPFLTDLSSKSMIHPTTNNDAKNKKNVIDILIVQGTRDTTISMMNTTTTKKEEFDSYFPPQVLHQVLPSNSTMSMSSGDEDNGNDNGSNAPATATATAATTTSGGGENDFENDDSCASSTTRTEMIIGGTHEGFSSYRPSFLA
ncbi:hypothetical protein FRACYDRAFT_245608 [Fragilariopsis cylindrus CCMP1102]|uniref:Uncharacterized protein n=1 Tax=Fragilariopsis cylindrus CCMP1102 TaxID=635003 RepID=A0A1E7F028_9STRA|nr:hypothetical protein FRACYDRAFT_245608 [Fragilariopsis cylindrus CCMP1102]|eukprot:OEU11552.1 hypothetical protein FRACYDRAFT_245608 [Fragilariopsis cylindrus CCMP1102]